jgi:hypothetical protein
MKYNLKWFRTGDIKIMLVDNRSGFGGWMNVWRIDGWE